MVKDTWCITYLRTGGDLWWDHAQLLMQVDQAIAIFEEAHPECVALFLFDHLSTHTLLGPDALCAFDMNKSNGGKQRKQKNTVIPMNNPSVECCRKLQKMTTKAGVLRACNRCLRSGGLMFVGCV